MDTKKDKWKTFKFKQVRERKKTIKENTRKRDETTTN